MRFENVRIESLAYVAPPLPISSADIEDELYPLYTRLKLPQGRLELMTGIRSRRFWDRHVEASEASAMAGRKALEKSMFMKDEIEVLIHSAVCRDALEPATAAFVHQQLGLSDRAQIFDVSNACLGFLNAMTIAGGLIESGQTMRVLICAGENGKPLLDRTLSTLMQKDLDRKSIKPYFANLTIGAGAAAAVLCHREVCYRGAPRLVSSVSLTDSAANELCKGDRAAYGGGLEMLTDSEALLEAGISLAQRTWERFVDETGWGAHHIDRYITHQVGRAHQRRLQEALQLHPEKDYTSYETFGNIGSVSLPLTLARAIESGAVEFDQKVALLGIGSGLSCMMMGVQF